MAAALAVAVLCAHVASLARPLINVGKAKLTLGPWQQDWGIATPNLARSWFVLSGRPHQDLAALESTMAPTTTTYETNLFLLSLRSGLDLLAKEQTQGRRIGSLDFMNPFPFVLGLPSVGGDILYWHYGRNVSDRMAFDPEPLLRQYDLLMEPKRPIIVETYTYKRRIFDPWFARDFEIAGENAWWRLYRRRTPQAP